MLQPAGYFNSTLMRIFAWIFCKFLPEEHNHANTIVRIERLHRSFTQ